MCGAANVKNDLKWGLMKSLSFKMSIYARIVSRQRQRFAHVATSAISKITDGRLYLVSFVQFAKRKWTLRNYPEPYAVQT